MKTEKDFYEDSWPDMTKYHKSKAPELMFDVWGWLRRLKAEKLKGIMDRSKLSWAKKEAQKKRDLRRQKTELMLEHRKRYRELFKEIREEAVREADHGMDKR